MRELMLATLAMLAAAPVGMAQNVLLTRDEYVYEIPEGWTRTVLADGILLESRFSTGEVCRIGLSALVSSSGDLFKDADRAWSRHFREFVVRPTMTFPATPHLARGVAGQGWEYVQIKRGLGLRGSTADPLQEMQFFGFVLTARLGTRVASVFGLSADPLVSSCFGTLGNAWPSFFSRLSFRSAVSEPETRAGLVPRIRGVWTSVGTSTGGAASTRFVFTPAGRYSEHGLVQRYAGDSPTFTATVTEEGSYRLSGNRMTLVPDKGAPQTASIRLEEVSEDGGRTWDERLYLVQPTRQSAACGPFPCGPASLERQFTRGR